MNKAFRTEREVAAYRVLHEQGEDQLIFDFGREAASALIDSWAERGLLRIKSLDPGRAPKPLYLMTASERERWNAHVAAHTGITIKTFAKYAR